MCIRDSGTDIAPVVGLDDYIFDISITANRPDCQSVLGLSLIHIYPRPGGCCAGRRAILGHSTLRGVDVQADGSWDVSAPLYRDEDVYKRQVLP